jgi:hypothetical protein
MAEDYTLTADRDVREQIPIHRVAKGLIDPHAVLIDGQSLRSSQHGRGLEAAV